MSITPDQCRAARAIIDWSQSKVADAAGISRATIAEFEASRRTPIANNLDAIRRTLEGAGVEFIPENGGGPGVRLVKKLPK